MMKYDPLNIRNFTLRTLGDTLTGCMNHAVMLGRPINHVLLQSREHRKSGPDYVERGKNAELPGVTSRGGTSQGFRD